MSDLHLEFEGVRGPSRPTQAWFDLRAARRACPGHPEVGPYLGHLLGKPLDLVVMAGDVALGTNGVTYAARVSLFLRAPVVYVAGNHEFYGCEMATLLTELRAAAAATHGWVTFLEQDTVTFDFGGQCLAVLGTTLWTDYQASGRSDADVAFAMRAAMQLSDHSRVKLNGEVFLPMHARRLHWESRAWLKAEMARIRAEGCADKVLVVTHHAPLLDASPDHYRGTELSPAFVSDMSADVEEIAPDLWVAGHTHHSADFMHGRTRFVSSQRGYVGAEEPGASSYVPAVVEL